MSSAAIPIPSDATIDPQSTQPTGVPIPQGAIVDADQSQPQQQPQQQPQVGSISAGYQPTSFIGKFGKWAENVANDLKYGTDNTGVGSVLKAMGAHGVYAGNSEKVGDFMASLPLGLLEAAQGTSQVTPEVLGGPKGQTVKGLKNIAGGLLQAATMPAAFAGPEETALSDEGLLNDASNAVGKAAGTMSDAASSAIAPVKKVVGATVDYGKQVGSGLSDLATNIPKQTESKLVDAIGDAAENAGFERGDSSTLKDAVSDLANNFKSRAQDVYQKLDEEAPGFQELKDKIGQLKSAYKTQLNLDPMKADEIAGTLKQAQSNMADLLDEGQQARWKQADQDWSRYSALQEVQGVANKAASDLTSNALQDVNKLHSGVTSLSSKMRSGKPIDVLAKAFGDDAGNIRDIVQDAADTKSNTQAAKLFLKWAAGAAGAGYAVERGGSALADALSGK